MSTDPPINLPEQDSEPQHSPVEVRVTLPEGVRVQVSVEILPGDRKSRIRPGSKRKALPELPARNWLAAWEGAWQAGWQPITRWARRWSFSPPVILFGLALLVYLLTRLIGLTQFPIYFFTDEAIQTVSAADLVQNGLRGPEKELLPTYFKNGPYYNLGLSVYLQVIPYLLFGKSAFVTRAVSVLISMLAAVSVGLILRDIFKASYWWSAALLLSIAPAWFLHSRTAFETVIFASLYASLLYSYLLYRHRSPHYIYATLLLAGLAFYAYSPGQLVIFVTGALLFFSDLRYHWQQRRWLLKGLGIVALLALPYIRFRLQQEYSPVDHLISLGSYWVKPMPLGEKLATFVKEYFYGLSPAYWFLPNNNDLERHLMKGYGHLSWWTLPFALLGLGICLRKVRSTEYRTLLAALLAAPAGSALVHVGITRALVFVVPATLLTALGLSTFLTWLQRWWGEYHARTHPDQAGQNWSVPRLGLQWGLALLLGVINFGMLRDALVNGPTWYTNYSLGGLQYGANQLFPAVREYLRQNPGVKLTVSPNWANGTDIVARFFLGDPLPVQMGSVDGYLYEKPPLDENMLFVVIPEELDRLVSSGKFVDIAIEKTLEYPNGEPGFYFVRFRYAEGIDQILQQERQARRQLQEAQIQVEGLSAQVRFSMLDMGKIQDMFDGDPNTVARTLEVNPLVIEITLPELLAIQGMDIIVGNAEVQITARLYAEPGGQPVEWVGQFLGDVADPKIEFDFGQTTSARVVDLEIFDLHQPEPAHVHIWEIDFR